MAGRDIVCVGASAGGIDVLLEVLRRLPREVPAAVFVVVHTASDGNGLLADILARASTWRIHYARDGQRIRHGEVYVAPPDHHLLLKPDHVRVTHGPRENLFRPAIDPLFRTAAYAYGPRVVGIVLSGGLDDGTHGLELIKQHGGVAIAQDPEEAIAPSMPLSAIRSVEVDYILKTAELPARITQLATESIDISAQRILPTLPDVAEGTGMNQQLVAGPASGLTCPECGGALWELSDPGRTLRYRCHVGHGYTAASLLTDQSDDLDNALWTALRALQEHSALQRRLADGARETGAGAVGRAYEREARRTELRAGTIRRLLQESQGTSIEADAHNGARPRARTTRRTARAAPKTRRRTRRIA